MNALFGSSSSKVLSVYLDEPTRIFSCGDFVSGTATLLVDLDAEGKQSKLDKLDASLRVEMMTTFSKPTKDNKNPEKAGETTRLFSSDTTIWKASEHPPSASAPGLELVKIPFAYKVPGTASLPLPCSFEGGTRAKGGSVEGHSVARVQYFIKFVARFTNPFVKNERLVVPFIVMPPPTCDPRLVPPPIIPRSVELPPQPPRPPLEEDGWVTATSKHDFREGWFAQKQTVICQLSVPSLPTFPRAHPIPFHLSFLLLAPAQFHRDPSSPTRMPTLSPPNPALDLSLTLVRNVFTQAHGKSQVVHQVVGKVVDFGSESRVWYGKAEFKPGPEAQGRWGCEVVVVGEMEVGWGETRDAGPSFGVEATKGLLSCGYHLRLNLALKGNKKTPLEFDQFLPLGISSTFASSPTASPPAVPPKPGETPPAFPPRRVGGTTDDLPPSYLQVDLFGEGLAPEPKGDLK